MPAATRRLKMPHDAIRLYGTSRYHATTEKDTPTIINYHDVLDPLAADSHAASVPPGRADDFGLTRC